MRPAKSFSRDAEGKRQAQRLQKAARDIGDTGQGMRRKGRLTETAWCRVSVKGSTGDFWFSS